MSNYKTAALMSAAATVGAIHGEADEAALESLRRFGRNLGLAFQAVDDVLGIWGEPSVTGKPAANDLRQRKKTIPVVHALTSDAGPDLKAILSNGEPTETALRRAVQIMEQAGSRDWARDLAWRNLVAAMAALEGAPLDSKAADELRELAGFVIRRDF